MGGDSVPFAPEELATFFTKMAIAADTINPHISAPYAMEPATEIDLTGGESDGSRSASEDALSFDVDEEP